MKEKSKRGGPQPNSGRRKLPVQEKKQPLAFQVKYGLHAAARLKIQPIVDEINKQS